MVANQWLLKFVQASPLGTKSVIVFIMKSSNHHMAVAVSHAVCVRRASSCRKRDKRKETNTESLEKYNMNVERTVV